MNFRIFARCLLSLLLLTASLPAHALPDETFGHRHALAIAGSTLGLFLNALAGTQAARDKLASPQPLRDGPRYNHAHTEPDLLMASKVALAHPEYPWMRGINQISHREYLDFLQYAATQPPDVRTPFQNDLLNHLCATAPCKPTQIIPSFELYGTAGYTFANGPTRAVPGVKGTVNPLLELDEGKFATQGNLGELGVGIRGGIGSWLSFDANPTGLFESNTRLKEKSGRFYLPRGYVKLNANALAVTAGRDRVHWGFGRHGTMMYSGNAEPFNLLRIGTDRAVILPWFFKYLGPTKSEVFVTFLEDDRTFPYAMLVGSNTTFQIHPRFAFGLAQTVQFGGKGSSSWSPLNYFSEILTDNSRVNRNYMAMGRWRIPGIEIETYAELFWEDCCDYYYLVKPRDMLNLVGVFIPNIGNGRADLAIEWARTNAITYRGIYPGGFFYKNDAIGHPIGPDGHGVYATLRYFQTPALWGEFLAAFEQRGRVGPAVPEDRYRGKLDVHYEFRRHWHLHGVIGLEHVLRHNFDVTQRHYNVLSGLRLSFSS